MLSGDVQLRDPGAGDGGARGGADPVPRLAREELARRQAAPPRAGDTRAHQAQVKLDSKNIKYI